MKIKMVSSYDGVRLRCAHTGSCHEKCIALVLPFGMPISLAGAFFNFYQSHYDVVTWESRLILDPPGREVNPRDFTVDNHVEDLMSVFRACRISHVILVGYCSGSGIVLAAANKYPQSFSELILVHGEYMLLDEESCTTQFAADIDSLLSLASNSEKHAVQVFDKVSSDRQVDNSHMPNGVDTPFTQLHYLRRYAANYMAYKSTDFKSLAKSILHRSLLLTGKRDIQTNVESSRVIHGLMKNSAIHVDPNADHYGILRDDSATLAAIWNHLSV